MQQQVDSLTISVPSTDSISAVKPLPADSTPAEEVSVEETPIADTQAVQAPVVQPQAVKKVKKDIVQQSSPIHAAPSATLENRADTSTALTKSISIAQVPDPTPREKASTVWEIPLLISVLLIFALLKAFNRRRIELIFKSLFNTRSVPQYLREENAFSNQVMIGMTAGFIIAIAALAFQCINYWFPEIVESPFRLYTQLCLFIVLVYICKFAILELLAEVFDQSSIVREYIFSVLTFNILAGVCVLPIVLANSILIEHEQAFLIAALVIVGITYFYRNWRAVKIGLTYKQPPYYIFLYLCTLEILPGIVLVKLLQV